MTDSSLRSGLFARSIDPGTTGSLTPGRLRNTIDLGGGLKLSERGFEAANELAKACDDDAKQRTRLKLVCTACWSLPGGLHQVAARSSAKVMANSGGGVLNIIGSFLLGVVI